MRHSTALGRAVRAVLLILVGLFFLFPILWVFLMSFQTNEQILRIPLIDEGFRSKAQFSPAV